MPGTLLFDDLSIICTKRTSVIVTSERIVFDPLGALTVSVAFTADPSISANSMLRTSIGVGGIYVMSFGLQSLL